MIWDDSSPLIVTCYAGKKYVLLQANVVHHLPLVSKKELRGILSAIHDFTVRGELWNIHKWNAALNKTLDEFFWTTPGIALKIEEIKEPEVMFSSLEASPPTIHLNPTSTPKILNIEDLDADTENEEEGDEDGITRQEAQEIIMRHSLPKAVSRKNVQLPGEGEAEEEDTWMESPPADQQQKCTNSPPEEEAVLQEWCSQEHVSLPTDTLNVSDGSIKPLSPREEKELRDHINSGHVKKSNLRKGCLLSEGPRKPHKRVRDVDRATHVLHIDIAGPHIESREGHHYFLVGALRLPDRPLLIDARLLETRTSVEVCAALERMTSFFESLSFEGSEITGSPRIKRLHSDTAREFTALYFQKLLSNHRSIYHTLTTGYDPQANGTAERSVGLGS